MSHQITYFSSLLCFKQHASRAGHTSILFGQHSCFLTVWSKIIMRCNIHHSPTFSLISSFCLCYCFSRAILGWIPILTKFGIKSQIQNLKYNSRNSHRKCSVKKGILENFAIFTGKPLFRSLFLKSCWPLGL